MGKHSINRPARKRRERAKREKTGRTGRILIIVGAILLTLGLFAFLGIYIYVGYTNRFTGRAQEELLRTWEKSPPKTEADLTPGEGIARIIIPAIKVNAVVVELSSLGDDDNLKRGPGHVPGTAYPGRQGNTVISGHRTTYGAPFGDLDRLKPGDEIIFHTGDGRFAYRVYETRVVSPNDMSMLDQSGETRVTLLACHPKFTGRQRIAVIGRLTESQTREK